MSLKDVFAEIANKKAKYPESVDEVLEDIKFKSSTIKILNEFKAMKPFHGDIKELRDKFRILNKLLSDNYKRKQPVLAFDVGVGSCYLPFGHTIILDREKSNKYSVVVFLHEFRHSMGYSEEHEACRWSINLFRQTFPKHYDKLTAKGHLLMKK